MKSLNRKIDRFCMNHPQFGIPRLMLFIVIGNVLVYLLMQMDTTGLLYNTLVFNPAQVCRGQVWRLITFLFVPEYSSLNDVLWMAIALYFYYFIGNMLEREWGEGRFTIYYFSGVLISELYAVLVYLIFGFNLPLSTYYLNMSLFFAFATLWPEHRVLLFFIIPLKMKWLALADGVYFLYTMGRCIVLGIQLADGAYFAYAFVPLIVLIPYLLFCGQWLFDRFRPEARRARTAQRARTIEFKTAAARAEQKKAAADNERRCAVCGRTARENPGLEFRYCSRCAGYHCFCIDHINNHVHFTE